MCKFKIGNKRDLKYTKNSHLMVGYLFITAFIRLWFFMPIQIKSMSKSPVIKSTGTVWYALCMFM